MYTLVTLADVVQIEPPEFQKHSMRAVEDFINKKYADKVIPKIGLCVGFHSLISASEGLIGPGTGAVNVNVDFRLIVFRPFKGEILRATITRSSSAGIELSADFFEEFRVPPETLFENSNFEKDENGTWMWIWRANEGVDLFFDSAESCMLRVEEEEWNDVSPDTMKPQDYPDEEGIELTPPYRILGSMMHSGLGPKLWWNSDGAEGDAMADMQTQEDEDETMAGA